MPIPSKRLPRRGEIWFVKLAVDPPDKRLRPVLIVSVDVGNQHERADTVLAIPLTTSIHKEVPTHILFTSAETGLPSDFAARAEDVTVIRKDNLVEPRSRLRQIGSEALRELFAARAHTGAEDRPAGPPPNLLAKLFLVTGALNMFYNRLNGK